MSHVCPKYETFILLSADEFSLSFKTIVANFSLLSNLVLKCCVLFVLKLSYA